MNDGSPVPRGDRPRRARPPVRASRTAGSGNESRDQPQNGEDGIEQNSPETAIRVPSSPKPANSPQSTPKDRYGIPWPATPYDYTMRRWLADSDLPRDFVATYEELLAPYVSFKNGTAVSEVSSINPTNTTYTARTAVSSRGTTSQSPWSAPLDPDDVSICSSSLAPSTPLLPVPPHVLHKAPLSTRIKIMRIESLLMKCQLVCRRTTIAEGQPWNFEQDVQSGKGLYYEYSKMRKVAETALKVADEVSSDGLKSRCWFWIGRARGGMREWHEAALAFGSAWEHMGVEYASRARAAKEEDEGETQKKHYGLYPAELAQLRPLMYSVIQRAQKREKESYAQRVAEEEEARRAAEETGQEVEDLLEYTKSPSWRPDLEMVGLHYAALTGVAMEELQGEEFKADEPGQCVSDKEKEHDAKTVIATVQASKPPLPHFSQAELDYITHGIPITKFKPSILAFSIQSSPTLNPNTVKSTTPITAAQNPSTSSSTHFFTPKSLSMKNKHNIPAPIHVPDLRSTVLRGAVDLDSSERDGTYSDSGREDGDRDACSDACSDASIKFKEERLDAVLRWASMSGSEGEEEVMVEVEEKVVGERFARSGGVWSGDEDEDFWRG